ncbi:peptide chain release factor N(5)-glutamine methyltransferase [Mucilaginibacter gilvus]|uniref:Release factor glutamine methyltransferase n=1 Tax=Mucilaginibacter gilvus TaxID=2305909 RepID=A0A444MRI3_9SPHI|nr:peptide chain release factor N(5)-glutamine methyltransferase [Mucilaginibacter gilvus]RWY54219.1 peptide chain release factor N(5)-glutamine methyltransferase [Mucilaginibacter gilvus]
MKTIKDVFLNFHQVLDELYGAQETEAITLMVLSEITDLSRAKIKAFPEDDVPTDAREKLPAILTELKTCKPVQYILGSTEFYGLSFLVNPATLIPRPETEELVEWALLSLKLNVESQKSFSILDIGTGSGCIAISLKKNLPDAAVTAVDISAEALQTAKQNAVINEVDVEFIEVDVLKVSKSEIENRKFEIIISNPPYVTLHDKTLMHTNVTDFEPHSALFVPEDDPLLFYKAIADFAAEKLITGGLLFFEINEAFGKETVELLADKGFTNIELRKDMSGRDRMVKATI